MVHNNLIRRQQAHLSSTRIWRIVSYRMILIVLLAVVSMKSSFAFVPGHHHTRSIISSSSNKILPSCMTFPYHHSPQQHRMRMTTTTTTTTAPEEQEQQQQQQLDEEYFNALQNFAAAATTTSDSNIDHDVNGDIHNTADTATTNTNTNTKTKTVSSSSSSSSSSWRDDGFVFGLNDELQRPTGKQALIVVEGDSMETQPYQVALVLITLLNHMYYMFTSIIELYQTNTILTDTNMALWMTVLQILGVSLFSWISADLGSGILHWSVDNYGNGRTPIMGNIIAAFQGHHTAPWTITQRSFFNNVYKLCIPFGIIPVTIMAYLTGPIITYFFTTFCILEILSQEFHKWSHQMKSETPWIGNLLQKYHLSIGRVPHTKHHTIPFDTNYCIISGICNPILDQYGFFRRLEHYIYQCNGIESNAWKLDPILRQRTMNRIYTPPDTI